jgi:hypothetical protein
MAAFSGHYESPAGPHSSCDERGIGSATEVLSFVVAVFLAWHNRIKGPCYGSFNSLTTMGAYMRPTF